MKTALRNFSASIICMICLIGVLTAFRHAAYEVFETGHLNVLHLMLTMGFSVVFTAVTTIVIKNDITEWERR